MSLVIPASPPPPSTSFLSDDLKGPLATASPTSALANWRSKHEIYDIEEPHPDGDGLSYELSSDEEETGIAYRSPGMVPNTGRDTPTSAIPLIRPAAKQARRSHKHTAQA